ncbi:MAG: hypothetical protein ACRBN8_28405 [Nannocystales bacterium]
MRKIGWATVTLFVLGCDPSSAADDTDTDTDTGSPATTASITTGGGPSTTTGNSFDQTLACQSWLECLDGQTQEQLSSQYGPGGTCWTQTVSIVEMCDADCVAGYNASCIGGSPTSDTNDDTTGEPIDECALHELAPGAESWVEAGDEATLIPTEIGTLIERVCSCHVADLDAFVPDAPLYYGNARFFTQEQMHSNFEGAQMYVEVGIRALDEQNMPPVYFCGEGEYGSLHEDEYAILQAWIEAEAPDGAAWLEERPDDLPTLD